VGVGGGKSGRGAVGKSYKPPSDKARKACLECLFYKRTFLLPAKGWEKAMHFEILKLSLAMFLIFIFQILKFI